MKTISLLFPFVLLLGCGNPADKVPEAKVTSSTNASASATAATKPPESDERYFALDPNASSVGFIGSKVTGSHNGGFKKLSGEFRVANGKVADTGNKVAIDTTSIWTDTDRLTGHLKSPDFFDVARFPTATFETTSIKQDGTNSMVAGNLTLHGVTKQISFPANIQVSENSVEVTADFFINRFDFEIKYAGKTDDLIRKEVVLKLKVKAIPGRATFATN